MTIKSRIQTLDLCANMFQPSESLKAMVYFEDGDLNTLTRGEKSTLVKAVSEVGDLPQVEIVSRQLTLGRL